jgi:predicted component of type VI protein secretion system
MYALLLTRHLQIPQKTMTIVMESAEEPSQQSLLAPFLSLLVFVLQSCASTKRKDMNKASEISFNLKNEAKTNNMPICKGK